MGVFVCILNILLQYTTAMDRNELLLSALRSAFWHLVVLLTFGALTGQHFLLFGCFADFSDAAGSSPAAICLLY